MKKMGGGINKMIITIIPHNSFFDIKTEEEIIKFSLNGIPQIV